MAGGTGGSPYNRRMHSAHAAPAAPPPLSGGIWRMVWLLMSAQTLGSVATTTLPAVAPAVAAGLEVPSRLIGYQISLVAAAMLISLGFGGGLGRRFGACRVTQAAMALIGAGAAICAIPAIPALAFGTVLMGLGYGLITPAASHLMIRFTPPERRNVIFSIKQTGVPLGGILAAALQPALAVWLGWQATLVVAALASFSVVAALHPNRSEWDRDREARAPMRTHPLAGLAIVWRRPALRNLSLAGALLVTAQICVSTFTVVMFVEEVGYSLVAAGFVLTVSQAGGVCGRLLWGWIADRSGNCLATLVALCAVMALGAGACVLIGPSWPLVLVYALFFLLGSTASGWNGAFLAEIARVSPAAQVGVATAGSLFLVNGGKLVGPVLVAQTQALTGAYTLAFACLAVPSLLALCLLLFANRSGDDR